MFIELVFFEWVEAGIQTNEVTKWMVVVYWANKSGPNSGPHKSSSLHESTFGLAHSKSLGFSPYGMSFDFFISKYFEG